MKIKVGDTVMVVRPWSCCPKNDIGIGKVGTVRRLLRGTKRNGMCWHCDKPPASGFADMGDGLCPLDRLIRLPSLDQPQDVKRDEEITA